MNLIPNLEKLLAQSRTRHLVYTTPSFRSRSQTLMDVINKFCDSRYPGETVKIQGKSTDLTHYFTVGDFALFQTEHESASPYGSNITGYHKIYRLYLSKEVINEKDR